LNPLDIDLGFTAPNSVWGTNCNGFLVDVSSRFSSDWSTANTAIATVDTNGTHTGRSAGTTTTTVFGYLPTPAGLKCPNQKQTVSGNDNVQVPKYFFSPSAKQTGTPSACVQEGFTGYFVDVSYYVADQNSTRISKSGMAPGENLGDGKGWHDAYATPPTTGNDGSFDDTPFGACYGTSVHYCEAGPPQSFRLTNNGNVFSIMTNTTSRKCIDGIELVIQGNPTTPTNQNKTYTFGHIQ
jgi:hypothetical protein